MAQPQASLMAELDEKINRIEGELAALQAKLAALEESLKQDGLSQDKITEMKEEIKLQNQLILAAMTTLNHLMAKQTAPSAQAPAAAPESTLNENLFFISFVFIIYLFYLFF